MNLPANSTAEITTSINTLSGGHSFSYQKPIVQNKSPPGRGGCTSIFADGKLVVFGGHYFEGDDKFTYLNDIWLLDNEKLIWHKIPCTGEVPGPRYGHSCHLLGSRMFIFGGKGPRDVVYKDVYFLDLIEWVWVPVNTISNAPAPRFMHASELVGRKIVVHGGRDNEEVFNDLWIFNTDSFVWMQPRSAGFGPTPRYGHTLTLTADGRLIVFGGCSIDDASGGIPRYNDDIRQLDTDTMVWTRPRVSGHVPTGRYGHTSTLLSDGRILLFGGWGKNGCQSKDLIDDDRAYSMQVLDTKTMTWFVPRRSSNKQVKHLYNHCACRASASSVFIFGGYDGRQAVGDFYVINIDSDVTNH
mmetsp:Transcript_7680/g.8384  ORF Transcript_7680/g.8384 Transcript_7680/m.8384 type:complete len:356 (-) Transcript_7680:842-1909(-)|eukprot:CAMPEP_0173156344 /NCGR_PEP_ID=MMETSP1105-20130129/14740_1 /TAXON_ID=2985 /ORGANISM="Ochromonas sp., Strain BG-1" /LENGTH=355 /DNA_ID=CAMNT_0014073133 /DNA_START=36 /DNA_END=1103 /DNA_ORIENTATION=-